MNFFGISVSQKSKNDLPKVFIDELFLNGKLVPEI
jgi:hypothetical protein